MSSDAARLEALGEPLARFRWRSHDLTIPRALEDWPLDLIRDGRYVDAVLTLLGNQTAPVPLYADLVSLSDAMAAAAGVTRLPEQPALTRFEWPKDAPAAARFAAVFTADMFGAVPTLLALLDGFEDDIAADLRTFCGVDYLDRWRGGLTLRQIWVYIRRPRPTSALAVACNGGHELWTKPALVMAQVWEQISRQKYYGRPAAREEIEAAAAWEQENQRRMDTLAAKEDYYSPEASQARMEAARQQRALAAARIAAGGPPTNAEPPSAALAALDKAVAARRRAISRKAG